MKFTKALASLAVAAATLPGVAGQSAAATPSSGPAAPPLRAEQRPRDDHVRLAQQKLKTFHTMFVYSDTVYLDSDVLRKALMKRFEVHAWKLELGEKSSADVWIKVWRPTFTFDWRYRMTDPATGQELGAGRIVAWDGKRAADGLAADIARTIGRVRALPTHLLAALGEEPNARKWQFKYHNGSEGPRQGVRLTVSVSPERIVGRRDSRVVFVVPAQSVSGISYNLQTNEPAKGWEAFWDSAFSNVGDDPNAAMGALMLIPVALAGDVLLKQFKRTGHFCEIAWADNGTVRNIIFKADSTKAAQDFLAAVEQVSHRKASDMEAEAAALAQAVEREDREGRFVPVRLDKETAVGWKILEPGAYRVIVVERDHKPAIAYFMPDTGATQMQATAAQIPVVIEPRIGEPGEQPVRYREANGIASIEEIITSDKTLRFRAIPLEFASEPQISEDVEETLAQAALRPWYGSVHVKSGTVYLKREVMEQALVQHPAFIEWEVKVAPRPEDADLELVVKRPFLTFDWTYVVTEVKTGKRLAEGKITARDGGRAASLIADQIVNALKAKAAQGIRNEVE